MSKEIHISEPIETVPVSTRITHSMRRGINVVLEVSAYINMADYLRDLIRKDLGLRGIKIEGSSNE